MNSKATQRPLAFVVDDDPQIRHAIGLLLDSVDQPHAVFASPLDFLETLTDDHAGCLVSDIRMPEMDGLELQKTLAQRDCQLPVIFITGHGDVPMAVEAMQKGAVSFLQKPFRDQELLDCIKAALAKDSAQRAASSSLDEIGARLDRLTAREREVMELVVAGKSNKVIGYELGVSQRTVEIHRARVMEKMEARSLAELVRLHLRYSDA